MRRIKGESHALDLLRSAVPTASPIVRLALGWEPRGPRIHTKADLFYCGDEDAKSTVEQLITDIGLSPVYVGEADRVGLVEGMTDMWFNMALKQQRGRRIAFKLLT